MLSISVIVPVYNVERYLSACLSSIRSQNYSNFEIVCVNDGSKDGSAAILDLAARADARIRVVNKANGGLSSARNAGIAAATGDIVCFVDSDDLLGAGALKRIAAAFTEPDIDLVTFGGEAYPAHRADGWLVETLSPRDVVYDTFSFDLLSKEHSNPFVWRTACRRSFLIKHHLLFDEDVRFGEDRLFHYAAYPRARRTALISDKLYLYRIDRPGSLMASRSNDWSLRSFDHIRITEAIARDWSEGGFIEQFGYDLLKDSANFLLADVMRTPQADRTMMLNFLHDVWTTYFTEEQLHKLVKHRTYGSMARAVLCDRKGAFGLSYKCKLYREALMHNRRLLSGRMSERFWRIPVLGRFCSFFRGRLPLSRRKQWALNDDVLWEISDNALRSSTLEMLRIEATHADSHSALSSED